LKQLAEDFNHSHLAPSISKDKYFLKTFQKTLVLKENSVISSAASSAISTIICVFARLFLASHLASYRVCLAS